MNKEGIFDIALFPIPGSVSFPQTVVPLHVFEPRYRQMIQDCIDKKMLLGVCHTKSIERFASSQSKQAKDMEELYSLYRQNLSTFSPEDVFSAGPVEINEQTEDGRYIISIFMLKRFRILDVIQNSPYKIAKCEEYKDDFQLQFEDVTNKEHEQRKFIIETIDDQLLELKNEVADQFEQLKAEKSVNNFTFKIFGFLRMNDIEMQKILNSRDPLERLDKLYWFFKSEFQ